MKREERSITNRTEASKALKALKATTRNEAVEVCVHVEYKKRDAVTTNDGAVIGALCVSDVTRLVIVLDNTVVTYHAKATDTDVVELIADVDREAKRATDEEIEREGEEFNLGRVVAVKTTESERGYTRCDREYIERVTETSEEADEVEGTPVAIEVAKFHEALIVGDKVVKVATLETDDGIRRYLTTAKRRARDGETVRIYTRANRARYNEEVEVVNEIDATEIAKKVRVDGIELACIAYSSKVILYGMNLDDNKELISSVVSGVREKEEARKRSMMRYFALKKLRCMRRVAERRNNIPSECVLRLSEVDFTERQRELDEEVTANQREATEEAKKYGVNIKFGDEGVEYVQSDIYCVDRLDEELYKYGEASTSTENEVIRMVCYSTFKSLIEGRPFTDKDGKPRFHDMPYNKGLIDARTSIFVDTKLLSETTTLNNHASKFVWTSDGQLEQEINGVVNERVAKKLGERLGDGLDFLHEAEIALREEMRKCKERNGGKFPPHFSQDVYNVRRLKKRVYVREEDSKGGYEDVECVPIHEVFLAVRAYVKRSRAIAEDKRDGYTYIESFVTDEETGESEVFYLRSGKYADVGGYQMTDANIANRGKNTYDPEEISIAQVEMINRKIEELNLTQSQHDILALRMRGYGYKAIATYRGVTQRAIAKSFALIQKKAVKIELTEDKVREHKKIAEEEVRKTRKLAYTKVKKLRRALKKKEAGKKFLQFSDGRYYLDSVSEEAYKNMSKTSREFVDLAPVLYEVGVMAKRVIDDAGKRAVIDSLKKSRKQNVKLSRASLTYNAIDDVEKNTIIDSLK